MLNSPEARAPFNCWIAFFPLALGLVGCNGFTSQTSVSSPAPRPVITQIDPPVQGEPAHPTTRAVRSVLPAQTQAPAAAPSATPARPIRVMTYNLGLLKLVNPTKPEPSAESGKSDVVPLVDARAALAPGLLAAYVTQNHVDVLGLEEVWLKPDVDKISAALKQAGYNVFVPAARPPDPEVLDAFFDLFSASKSDNMSADIDAVASIPLPSVRILGSGLLLAVGPGMRMLHPEFHAFRETGGFERFTTKGMITAEVEQTEAGQPSRFFATLAHFQAQATYQGKPYRDTEAKAFPAQQDQARRMIQEAMDSKQEPAVLFGDTNSGYGYLEPSYERFVKEFGYREAYYEANPSAREQGDATWDQQNPLVRAGEVSEEGSALIDHIFLIDHAAADARKQLKWKADSARISFKDPVLTEKIHGGVPLSDHYASEAVIELSEP